MIMILNRKRRLILAGLMLVIITGFLLCGNIYPGKYEAKQYFITDVDVINQRNFIYILDSNGNLYFMQKYKLIAEKIIGNVESVNNDYFLKKDGTLWYLDADNELKQICDNVKKFILRGQYINILKKDDSLWTYEFNELYNVADHVKFLYEDYFITKDNVLHHIKLSGKTDKIADHVRDCYIIERGKFFYIKTDGSLFSGDDKKRVTSDVERVIHNKHCLYILKQDRSLWIWQYEERNKFITDGDRFGIHRIMDNVQNVYPVNDMVLVLTYHEDVYLCDDWGGHVSVSLTNAMDVFVQPNDSDSKLFQSFVLQKDGILLSGGENKYFNEKHHAENEYLYTKVLEDVKEFSISERIASAVKNDGTLWAWGKRNTVANSYMPKMIDDGIKEILYNREQLIAQKKDGSLYVYGENPVSVLDFNSYVPKEPMKIAFID